MPLETGSFINDLTTTNPSSSDPVGQGDDHLRLIKSTLQGSLPNFGSILGQVRRQDTALSISSTWNTNHFICSASATATVVLTLPPAASVTTGFYVDITTIGTGTVSLLPSGAASINGGVSLSIPRLNTARAYFVTGTGWLADVVPHGNGGYVLGGNVTVDGTLSVSGAAMLNSTLSVSAAAVMGSTLAVRGATTLDSTLSVSGAATFNGAVSISGNSVFTGTTTHRAAVTLDSTLSVSGAAIFKGAVSISGGVTIAGNLTVSGSFVLTSGQIKFPATQNPSTDANTLDDYEEGTWTPTLSFATNGDANIVLSTALGQYVKIGKMVYIACTLVTSTFTHTTASGNLQIGGMPFTADSTITYAFAMNVCVGFTQTGANHQICPVTSGSTTALINAINTASGGTMSTAQLGAANHATGTNIQFGFSGSYRATA